MRHLTADIIGLLDALGRERCVLVGHDWGSGVGWACAELYPERVAAMFHLGIAYTPRGDEPPTASIAKFAGDHFSSDGTWKRWRDVPGFSQRSSATFGEDGKTIREIIELSRDGVTWELDMEKIYAKLE